jgi:hypothetical protein
MMNRSKEIKKMKTTLEKNSARKKEIERLSDFMEKMKAAGLAKSREYDLPGPDTIGKIRLRTKTSSD